MKIDLTKEQYENLVKIVYLGNWVVNAIRTGAEGDERIEKYEDTEQYIFSFYKDFGLEKYIEYDKEFKEFFPTSELEDNSDTRGYLEDYDNEAFWDELGDRLGDRDFFRKYTEEEIKAMDQKERFLTNQKSIIKYEEEFEKYGIDRLELGVNNH